MVATLSCRGMDPNPDGASRATDTETAMNLPNGLAPPQSDGFFLVAGDGDEELLYLSAGLNLRPVSHDGSGNWVVPPLLAVRLPSPVMATINCRFGLWTKGVKAATLQTQRKPLP